MVLAALSALLAWPLFSGTEAVPARAQLSLESEIYGGFGLAVAGSYGATRLIASGGLVQEWSATPLATYRLSLIGGLYVMPAAGFAYESQRYRGAANSDWVPEGRIRVGWDPVFAEILWRPASLQLPLGLGLGFVFDLI
jgi:hypothetical protein